MALKDVKSYYLDMQAEYLEAKDNQLEMINEYKQGNIDNEQLENFQKYFDDIETNYKRLSYIMYLFNLPTRKDKQNKYNKANTKLQNYFIDNKVTKEDIKLENQYILDTLQKILKEGKS